MKFVYEGVTRLPGIAVTLSLGEMSIVTDVAKERQSEAIRMRLPDRHGYTGNGLKIHIQGASGEYALATALGRDWEATVNTFKAGGDVGLFQVRTRSNHEWDLILRQDDRPDDIFFLVTGNAPNLRIVGSILARDGMLERNIRTYGGRPKAWFVPKGDLTPFRFNVQGWRDVHNLRPLMD